MSKISVVIPAYNEEEVIVESHKRLSEVMQKCNHNYELIFVNDGSRDKTVPSLQEIKSKDDHVKIINFSRNFGHQIAVTAGLDNADGDAIVIIDADLQDPPEVILDMIQKWENGAEVVHGRRLSRQGETAFKKVTAKAYYRILRSLTGVEIPVDVGDFRLIDKKVRDVLCAMPEHNRYIRGLVALVGFRQEFTDYVRDPRLAGETKYSMKKMLKLASDGIFALSYTPIRIVTFVGFTLFVLGGMSGIYNILAEIFDWWDSFVLIIATFAMLSSGVIMLSVGCIGEYIARICDEVKARPLYIENMLKDK
ncbi:MAG: glycosyltransferase family 2 protein [Clostridiales bacterium]|jgi:dolichol-phosphate mannosyltransferase|nr:glycosyltransferase family 2 protein [Clostridiales bacterium]